MENSDIIDLIKKLNPDIKISNQDLNDKKRLKEISNKVARNLKKTNQNLNSYADIIRLVIIKNNPNKRDFIELVNNGLDSSSQKISDTYNNINELKIILLELGKYIKSSLKYDLNKIQLGNRNQVLSEIVRNVIWEGPKFNNTNLSLGMKLRDLVDNITHTFRTENLNQSLDYNRKLVIDSQKKLDLQRQFSEKEIIRLKKDNFILKGDIEKLELKFSNNNEKKEELERIESKLRVIIADLENKITLGNQQKIELNSRISEFGQNNSGLIQEKDQLTNNLNRLNNELKASNKQIQELEQYKTKIYQQNSELSNKYDRIIYQKRQLSEQISSTNQEQLENVSNLQQTIRDLNNKLGSLTQDYSKLENEKNSLLQLSEKNTFEDLKKLLIKLKRNKSIDTSESISLARILWGDESMSMTTPRVMSQMTSSPQLSSVSETPKSQYKMAGKKVMSQMTSSPLALQEIPITYMTPEVSATPLTPVTTATPTTYVAPVPEIYQITSSPQILETSETPQTPQTSETPQTPQTPEMTSTPQIEDSDLSDKLETLREKALKVNKKRYDNQLKQLNDKSEELINYGKYKQVQDISGSFETLKLRYDTNEIQIKNMNQQNELKEIIGKKLNKKLTGLVKIKADQKKREKLKLIK